MAQRLKRGEEKNKKIIFLHHNMCVCCVCVIINCILRTSYIYTKYEVYKILMVKI